MQYQAHGVDLMDIACGGFLSNQTASWLEQRSEALMSSVNTATQNWFGKAREFYTSITESDAIQALRNLTFKADVSWQNNRLYNCDSIELLQTANPVMQRYIMAEPRLRELYLNDSVEGYAGSYENYHGDAIGTDHYDYRRVTDGIVMVHDDHAIVNQFFEVIPESDRELDFFEKADVIRTWNMVNQALDAGETDPTSPIGNLL